MSNSKTTYSGRMRITTYIEPDAWAFLTRLAMAGGSSVSGYMLGIIQKHLERNGFEGSAPMTRKPRKDFDPAATLHAALGEQEQKFIQQAARVRAKLARIEKLRAKSPR